MARASSTHLLLLLSEVHVGHTLAKSRCSGKGKQHPSALLLLLLAECEQHTVGHLVTLSGAQSLQTGKVLPECSVLAPLRSTILARSTPWSPSIHSHFSASTGL